MCEELLFYTGCLQEVTFEEDLNGEKAGVLTISERNVQGQANFSDSELEHTWQTEEQVDQQGVKGGRRLGSDPLWGHVRLGKDFIFYSNDDGKPMEPLK